MEFGKELKDFTNEELSDIITAFYKGVNMERCELNGCVYNENGACKYDEALIKVASATACYENFSEEE